MDKNQKLICDMVRQNPECITERSILRAALSDILPNDKLCQNVLLNAYDIDIVKSISNKSDATLIALNIISQLEQDYGITKDIAFWAVQTWCYVLKLDGIAGALETVRPLDNDNKSNLKPQNNNQEYRIGIGTYRAGEDFPAGYLSVQATTVPDYQFYYGVGNNPNRINATRKFIDKIYVQIEDGQFLRIESIGDTNYSFIVKKSN